MAKRTIRGTGKKYTGTAGADTLTVVGRKNTVNGARGNDRITVSRGSGHKVYGHAGSDTIIVSAASSSYIYGDDAKGKVAGRDKISINGGKNNTIYGGGGADTISVNKGSGHKVNAQAGNDSIIVRSATGSYIYGQGGNDIISVRGGSGNKIYGDDAKGKVAGKDKISINGGKQNAINAGQGADTITVNGGSSTVYGGKGNDVFVISKNSTGKAVVKDFKSSDKVKVAGGAVKNIKASGSDRIITGGKSGSLTLKGAKPNKFTVTDTNGEYTVSSSAVDLVLKKSFTGHFTAQSFLRNIDAGWVTANGAGVTGNAKANTINVANVDGGYYYGGGGNDTIIVNQRNNHTVYGDDSGGKLAGNDKITVTGGSTGNTIYGGKGNDTITVISGTHMIYGGDGIDSITVNSGVNGQTVHGDNGDPSAGDKDYITVSGGNIHSIFGEGGDDVIRVTGGVNHHIEGGAGKDTITVTNVTFDNNSSYTNSNGAYINAGYAGTKTVTLSGCKNAIVYGSEDGNTINILNSQNTEVSCAHGNDKVNITGGNNTKVYTKKGTNTISVSGKNVTIEQWGWGNYYEDKGAKDSVTVNWSANIGRLTIKTSYPENSNSVDALTINNVAVSNLKFYKVNTWDLLIESTNSNNGNSIFIDGWFSRKAFSNGVNIGGTPYKYSWISDRAMLKS